MSMQGDVSAAYLASTGTAVPSRTRLKALVVINSATAGSVILRDGGATGPVKFQMDVPAAPTATGAVNSIYIPDEGILFQSDIHGTLSNCTLTAIYG